MNGELVKILAVCLIAAVLAITVKSKSAEYAFAIAIAAGILISLRLIGIIMPAIKSFDALLQNYGVETEYLAVAIKAVGISYLTSFIADSCRDCGQISLASKAEFAGKCAIFILSLPLLISVLNTAIGFVK
ncbi:MAG: hypothetical protein J6J30_00915 [Clostridia bacterium]|jgi:stage III sporulation protein AD|nr:hypothetical protein [Clostridia bacterium]MEE1075475.1 SpoIIIAC/SpoIIIAD family protein [Acutalibacteraceae bacterium]